MKTLIFILAVSLFPLFSNAQEMKVRYSDNDIIPINTSMYNDILNTDVYYNMDAALIIKDMFLFNEIMSQERDDFVKNKVREVRIIMGYGKDSAKNNYALLKINKTGFIEEYITQNKEGHKPSLKFLYDEAGRLTEIVGTDNKTQRTFSYYKFIYYDYLLQEFLKWPGSTLPEEYFIHYSEINNQPVLSKIEGHTAQDNIYKNYSASYNSNNKLSVFEGKFLLRKYKMEYSEAASDNSGEDTIRYSNGFTTKNFIIKNNRIIKKIFVSEERGTKTRVPREIYETINYTYDDNDLLKSVESNVRDFNTFYLNFSYEFYE